MPVERILTDESAAMALQMLDEGWHLWEVAAHFKISRKTTYDLQRGFSHKKAPGKRLGRQYGTMDLRKARRGLYLSEVKHHSTPYISSKLGVGITTVKRILSGNWRPIWYKRGWSKPKKSTP